MLALSVATLLIWCWLIVAHGRFWQAGPVLTPVEADPARTWPPVRIVIPARDEAAGVADCLRSLLAQDYPGDFRIVLVDDRSGDGTGAIARAAGGGSNRLTVINGAERPERWSGKLWAVHQGVEAALATMPDGNGTRTMPGGVAAGAHAGMTGDSMTEDGAAGGGYLLLCDADIVHDPAHLATLVDKAERDRLDQVSEMVALNTASAAERALVPAFVFFFQLLYPFARVNRAGARTAAAAGGTVLIRRAALSRIGGIGSLRGALIDDVTLATRVKRAGGRIWLGHSMLARSVRPYPGAADVWRMVARTAYVQLRFSPLLLAGTVAGMVLVWVAPVLCLAAGHGVSRWLGGAAWLLSTGAYLPTLRRFRLSPFWALLLPAIGLFYTGATIGSAIDHHRGRGVVWKSRAYRDGEKDRTVA